MGKLSDYINSSKATGQTSNVETVNNIHYIVVRESGRVIDKIQSTASTKEQAQAQARALLNYQKFTAFNK